jgi:hypothetical protein
MEPSPVPLGDFAWRNSGVRELFINFFVNFLVSIAVFGSVREVPLWGWGGLIAVVGPMSYLMPWLTTFFGVFSGVRSRSMGFTSPALPPKVPWVLYAVFFATSRAIVCCVVTWITIYLLSNVFPDWTIPGISASLAIAVGSALVAYFLHSTAILSTKRFG